jgi:hypothetical protein
LQCSTTIETGAISIPPSWLEQPANKSANTAMEFHGNSLVKLDAGIRQTRRGHGMQLKEAKAI